MSAKKRQSSIVDLFKTSNPSSSNNSDPKRLSTASVSSSTVLISSSTASVSNKNISNCSNSTAPSCSISTVSSVQTHIINDIFPPYDLGCLIASIREMPSELRYKVIQNVDKPDQHFIFPYHDEGKNKKRCFQHKWLQDHTWLVYSKSKDGGLCLPCVLFAKTGHRSVGMFVVSALTKFKNATTEFSAHAACDYHRFAMQDFSSFISIMEQRQLSVVQMATTGTARRIQENREKLKSILDTVILCGRQNFALRGHKEGKEEKKCYKKGNFLALLDFRANAGDTLLLEHLTNGPKNASYKSNTIQNELIVCCGDYIRNTILSQVKSARYFSVMADEVTDISNTEQMSLCIRYFYGSQIEERFLDFILCDGLDGNSLATSIIDKLQSYGLDLSLLRGQCYDGAGNMAGKIKGAAAIISARFPKALYVHCNSHVLNLSVVHACQIQQVRNMMGTLTELCIFFKYSPKRHKRLQDMITRLCPETTRQKLVDLCKTRWVARHDALEVFGTLYVAVVETLYDIMDNPNLWNQESLSKANSIKLSITQFDFLLAFIVCRNVLRYIQPLTVSLQRRTIDICAAMQEVKTVIKTLKNCRIRIDGYFDKWFDEAETLGQSVNASAPQLPRTTHKQIHRANTPADTPKQSYHRIVAIPFLDHLLTELEARFGPVQITGSYGLSLLPPALASDQHWMENAIKYAEFVKDDLPSFSTVEVELECWKQKWTTGEVTTSSIAETIASTNAIFYPNIFVMLQLSATLPVTSCECERTFSLIRILKTYLRSTMGQERLSGLALLYIHHDIRLCSNTIIDAFARHNPRRMEFIDVMSNN
jgi:Domain of unknown function (DUF4371)/hAT family C-terminal dimerisation region